MRAKTLHPRKSTSRCPHREQRRRHPCNRRHTRALAVRRLSSSRADAQGLTRLRRGGTTGAYPSATARGRVWAPADARSLSTAGGAGGGPRRVRHGRPAGAAGAGPGEREQTSAGRSSAATRCILVVPPPQGGPAASGAAEGGGAGCFRAPVPAGGAWTRGRSSDRAARVRRTICSRCKCAQTRASPPVCDQRGSRVSRGGPGAKLGRSPAPCAALRGDRPEGGEHGALGEADRAARHREMRHDPCVVSLREVHPTRRPESCA